eukprot:Awhi_evm1s14992
MLALLLLAHSSDVLEPSFNSLSDDNYELVMKRFNVLIDNDPDQEAVKNTKDEMLWAVVDVFNNR